MLVALLLPAVQAAREAGRRMTCINNTRQLVIAAQNFESQKRRFPGYNNLLPVGTSFRQVGWVVELLPALENSALFEDWRDPTVNNPVAPYLGFMYCPSKGSPDRSRASNSYVYNCGFMPGDFADPSGLYPDFTNPSPYEDPSNPHPKALNVWFASMRAENTIGTDRVQAKKFRQDWDVSMDDLFDGASNTLIFSENLQAGEWSRNTYFTAGQEIPAFERLLTGFCWLYSLDSVATAGDSRLIPALAPTTLTPARPDIKINGIIDVFEVKHPGQARPSSYHPGIVIAGFAGGQVVPINEQTAYHVYQSLMTPNGRRSDQPLPRYQLQAEHYEP